MQPLSLPSSAFPVHSFLTSLYSYSLLVSGSLPSVLFPCFLPSAVQAIHSGLSLLLAVKLHRIAQQKSYTF